MKKTITILFLSVLFLACSGKGGETTAACGVDNPLEDLAWLKGYIEEIMSSSEELSRYFSVVQGTHDGETIFIFDNCCPICNTVVPIYDCEGNSLGPMNGRINRAEIRDIEVIYKPDNFTCSVD